jgi:hypothetical protein
MVSKALVSILYGLSVVNAQLAVFPGSAGSPTVKGVLAGDAPSVQENTSKSRMYAFAHKTDYLEPGTSAAVQSDLPKSKYAGNLPPTIFNNATGSAIVGKVVAQTNPSGKGVTFTFNLTGLPEPKKYGPPGKDILSFRLDELIIHSISYPRISHPCHW